jgi:hypothetical protein
MSTKPIDPLSLCVNANAIADGLDEYAELKTDSAANPDYLTANWDAWRQRLTRWAENEVQAAKTIRALVGAFDRLVQAIREHRDQRGDDRCWEDDAKLYAVLGEGDGEAETALPQKAEFLKSCERFYEQRQCPATAGQRKGMTIAQLEAEVERLREYEWMYKDLCK